IHSPASMRAMVPSPNPRIPAAELFSPFEISSPEFPRGNKHGAEYARYWIIIGRDHAGDYQQARFPVKLNDITQTGTGHFSSNSIELWDGWTRHCRNADKLRKSLNVFLSEHDHQFRTVP